MTCLRLESPIKEGPPVEAASMSAAKRSRKRPRARDEDDDWLALVKEKREVTAIHKENLLLEQQKLKLEIQLLQKKLSKTDSA